MKTHLKYLLGLVFMVFVFGGCQDPSRVEIPEGATVEFRWCSCFEKDFDNKTTFELNYPRYLLSLSDTEELSYEYPKGYDSTSWQTMRSNEESFKEFSKDIFEKVFGTKFYEEGTPINLTKWTRPAKDLVNSVGDIEFCTSLSFFEEDIENYAGQKSGGLEVIEVHNENIVVYVYWNLYQN